MEEKKKIRLALIGTNGIPANYGGAETLYENLTRELSDRFDITVYCSNRQPKKQIGDTYLGAKLKYWPLSANGWQSIPYDFLSLMHASRYSDVLFIFGFGAGIIVWLMRLFGCHKKIVIHHGGLDEWLRDSGHTRLRKWIGQGISRLGRHLLRNKVIHVTDNNLQVNSLKEWFGIEGVNVIRYGADQCSYIEPDDELKNKYPFIESDYYVSVSRAQVDNNLHIVLDAFRQMPDKKLVLVSNFKVSEYGLSLYDKYKKGYDNIVLIPGIYNKRELDAVRSNAVAYIHSHSRCGTPPSLCEAMYLGLPIISYDMPVNHEVTNEGALFFDNALGLKDIILNTTEENFKLHCAETTLFAQKHYTWRSIADQYAQLFDC